MRMCMYAMMYARGPVETSCRASRPVPSWHGLRKMSTAKGNSSLVPSRPLEPYCGVDSPRGRLPDEHTLHMTLGIMYTVMQQEKNSPIRNPTQKTRRLICRTLLSSAPRNGSPAACHHVMRSTKAVPSTSSRHIRPSAHFLNPD